MIAKKHNAKIILSIHFDPDVMTLFILIYPSEYKFDIYVLLTYQNPNIIDTWF